MVLTKYVDNTPYVILMWSMRANLSYLNIRRCDIYVKHIVSENIWAKSNKFNFIRYLKKTIGYYFYHPNKKKYLSQNMLPL